MQGVGCTDVLLYFKCPTTNQMRCPVKAYKKIALLTGGMERLPVELVAECDAATIPASQL